MCVSAAALRSPWSSSFVPRSLPWRSVTCVRRRHMPTSWSSALLPLGKKSSACWSTSGRTLENAGACCGSHSPLSAIPATPMRSVMNLRRILALTSFACALPRSLPSKPSREQKRTSLPTSKTLLEPVPGEPQRTNSLPVTAALSPDGKYLALLNNGFGSAESNYRQSIAVLDLRSNQLHDFPDARLATHAQQTYFLGLAWSGDGSELYASMASLTDPEGKKPGNTGNGIAVYRFADGALTPERFLKLPLVPLGKDKKNTYGAKYVPAGFVSPYPAGIAGGEARRRRCVAGRREPGGRRGADRCPRWQSAAALRSGTRQGRAQHVPLHGGGEQRRHSRLVLAVERLQRGRTRFALRQRSCGRSRCCPPRKRPMLRPIPLRYCSVPTRASSTSRWPIAIASR